MTAVAMMLKHTSVILPGVMVVFAGLWWFVKPLREGKLRESWRGEYAKRFGAAIGGGILLVFTMWALLLFDISRPMFPKLPHIDGKVQRWGKTHPISGRLFDRPWPGGIYISCLLEASYESSQGHRGYLFGEMRDTGWWYYFPVVATYKVPLGIAALMLMALIALKWNPPKWNEWSLLLPAIAWTALMMSATFNIGWRHFLPAYFFWMMLATRSTSGPAGWRVAAWCAIALGAAHALSFHPDYLSYINWPRKDVYLQINDSNIDWGQGLKQVRRWILAHPDRKVSVREFSHAGPRLFNVQQRLSDVATVAWDEHNRPTSGIFIISPTPLAGVYEYMDPYGALRKYKPIAIIGHCMRVYDLDKLRKKGKPFKWGPLIPRPPEEEGTPTSVKKAKKKHSATQLQSH
jgi:hypothetical protein